MFFLIIGSAIRATLGAKSVTEIQEFVARAEEDPAFPPLSLTIWSGVLDLVDIQGLEEREGYEARVQAKNRWEINFI